MTPERLPRHLLDPEPAGAARPLGDRIACRLRSHFPFLVTSDPAKVSCGRCLLIARRRRLLSAAGYRRALAAAGPARLPKLDPMTPVPWPPEPKP